MPETRLSRRWFALIGGLGLLTAAGCSLGQNSSAASSAASTPMPTTMDMSSTTSTAAGAATATVAPQKTARQLADEMDAHHEAGIKAFPAKTEGLGNQPLPPKIVGDAKVFDLTSSKVMW